MPVFAGGNKEKKPATSEGVTLVEETTSSEGSESLSSTVATVNLIKQVAITEEQVQEAMEAYKEYGISREDVLNSLIEDELINQALERDDFLKAVDYYKEVYLSQYRAYVNSMLGKEVTDEEFDQISYEYNGAGYEEISLAYAKNYVSKSYLQVAKGDLFENAEMPTKEEITSFYNKNISSFVSAENVKLAHVFFNFGEDKAAALAKAQQVSALINSGKLTFDEAVQQYTDDSTSKEKNGEIGYFSLDDKSNTSAMGQNFVDEIFKLNIGVPSSVIESNVGYHIVRISEHNSSRILGLEDKLASDQETTVYDYINSYLTEALYEELLQRAYSEVIAALKDAASIKIIEK